MKESPWSFDSSSPEYDEVDEGDEDHVESGDQDVEESYGVVDGQVNVDARLEEVGPIFFRLDIWDSAGQLWYVMNILVFQQGPEPNYHDHDGNVYGWWIHLRLSSHADLITRCDVEKGQVQNATNLVITDYSTTLIDGLVVFFKVQNTTYQL